MRLRAIAVTAPALVLLWLAIIGYLWQKHTADYNSAAQASRNLTQAFEENIHRTIESIDTTIRAVRISRAHEGARFDLSSWEADSGLTRELTLQLSLSDRNGDVVASNLGNVTGKRFNIADREHFRAVRDMQDDVLYISRPVLGRVSGRWSVQFVRKLLDPAGAFDGVIVASLDPAFLSRFYTSLEIGRGGLMLLGRDGIVRAAAPQTLAKLNDGLAQTLLLDAVGKLTHGTIRLNGTLDGLERVYSWRYVDPYGLVVVVGLATADALAGFWLHADGCIAIGVIVTLLAPLVIIRFIRHRRVVAQSQEMLQAAVENISQGLLVVDTERRVPVLNARAAELLGLPPHLSTPGYNFDSLLEWQIASGEFARDNDQAVRTLVESGGLEGGTSVYRRVRRNGTVLEVRTKVLLNGLAVRTYTDITDQEHSAHVLADARDAAEAAVKTRSEFLAVMSHEIRTPLNGVIGVAGLLEDMELGPEQRDYVRLIRQSGDHLLELVNDILDFSKLEAQRMDLEEVVFDPGALLQSIVGMFLSQAQAKGLRLSATLEPGIPATVCGDPGRLRQILLNLVSNAVKFTNEGWVSLNMAYQPTEDGWIWLMFSVADSGIGIIPEAIERMFQEFTQMDSSISRRFGGSGLGLAICRRLIEMMGGSITVESKPGAGSVFRFQVLLKPSNELLPSVAQPAAIAPSERGLHVLLAEDNLTNRIVAMRILERLGHRAEAVGNGLEALAALAEATYDLILMDVMMPEMDGLTATRQIRAAERDGVHISIVGLTAGSSAESLAACLEAGMDAVTTKPVTLARLREAIVDGRSIAISQSAPVRAALPPLARLQELADMLGKDAIAEIIHAFTEDSQTQLHQLQQAVERNDFAAMSRIAHSVAGAARNVGADKLAERASLLEQDGGTLSRQQIDAEIEAMRRERDALVENLAHAFNYEAGNTRAEEGSVSAAVSLS